MITFKDIEFRQHNAGEGSQGLIFFPGGYGLSVVRFKHPYSTRYSSYTDDKTWEVAILKGTKEQWEICYDTEITNDVLTYKTEEDINKMEVEWPWKSLDVKHAIVEDNKLSIDKLFSDVIEIWRREHDGQ